MLWAGGEGGGPAHLGVPPLLHPQAAAPPLVRAAHQQQRHTRHLSHGKLLSLLFFVCLFVGRERKVENSFYFNGRI